MNKIKQLEVKKLIKELNFVESDYTYKNEMVNEIETLFINSVNDFLEKHPELKEIFDKKVNQKIENIHLLCIPLILSHIYQYIDSDTTFITPMFELFFFCPMSIAKKIINFKESIQE